MRMTERQLTTAAYITLGLLTSRDWSAYQLAEEGLVAARIEPAGKRTRTIYSITQAGRDELAAWLTTDARPPLLEFEGMVRVMLSEQGSISDLRRTLQTTRHQALAAREMFAVHAATIARDG